MAIKEKAVDRAAEKTTEKSTDKLTDKLVANPFLVANFAPVADENVISDLAVTGTIPEELEGRFLRIGPNPSSKPNPKQYHWFLGTGMVHGVRLKGGKAEWYRNNYVLTDNAARDLDVYKRQSLITVVPSSIAPARFFWARLARARTPKAYCTKSVLSGPFLPCFS